MKQESLDIDSYWTGKQAQRERRARRHAIVGLGAEAPDFDLTRLGNETTIRLSSLKGRMVVLLFGSYTCPLAGAAIPEFNGLYQEFKDDVEFLLVYTREEHPIGDGRPPWRNPLRQHENIEERGKAAEILAREASVEMPIALDNMTNDTASTYSAFGVGCYLIDPDGKILYHNKSHQRVKVKSVRKRIVERLSGAA